MKNLGTTTPSKLLNSLGWDACVDAVLIRASDVSTRPVLLKSQAHALRRLFAQPKDGGLAIEAVLCVENRPTVCIRDGRKLSDADVATLRQELWNMGSTTLLLVERPHVVELYSTVTKPPQGDDRDAPSPLLSDETIRSLESAELALRLRSLIRRVETGAIYQDYRRAFDPEHAVDTVLLENLRAARDLICPHQSLEAYRAAHALIGRFLFSCYLLDRGIIGDGYLSRNHLPSVRSMQELLAERQPNRAALLQKLFLALHRDFNGSLFGEEQKTISPDEVAVLSRFLRGDDLRSGQMCLLPKFYDFSFIPVEFISSIYQEFLGAEADAAAKPTGRNQPRNTGQRRRGAYYTPPRLAELTVDIATEGWDTLLNKRCLDGACGSGVFLVILFIRMAEEWRLRNPDATTRQRYDKLMRLLAENLCGVDIELTACLVTCFSLYLAFLDQMDPKEIEDLREALNRDSRKILPRILWEHGKHPPERRTVRERDFFELEPEPEFDLVIGNPPWASRKKEVNKSAAEWILSDTLNPAAKEILKSKASNALFPAKEIACGFMWKASLHLKPGGRACQVLPSRMFLSNNTDRFQTHWLKHHRLESVWLLADYRRLLFLGAICPSMVVRYHVRREGEALGEFEFITPKVELLDPREALIPVQPEDQKILSEQDIVAAAEKTECALAWKKHHWGTPRDARLLDRLFRLKKLDSLCARPPDVKRDTSGTRESANKKRWWKGQGFQPASTRNTDEAVDTARHWRAWWDNKHAFYRVEDNPWSPLVVANEGSSPFGSRSVALRRSIAPELTRPPLVVVNKGFTKACYSDHPLLFQHAIQSICGPEDDAELLMFLAAYLDSPLAKHLAFHTSASMGIERDEVHLEEIMALPFPLPGDTRDPKRSAELVHECAEILLRLKKDLTNPRNLLHRDGLVAEAQAKLNKRVYDYFGICEWERQLIEDTVKIFSLSAQPGSLTSKKLLTTRPSTPTQRTSYATTLVETFKGWTRSRSNLWAATTVASKIGLAFVTFGVGGRPPHDGETEAEERVEELLERIRSSASEPGGTVFHRLRGFTFYEGTRVHLLKPLSLRHWTRTAALNDADNIIAHMMREDGWGA